MNVLLRSVTLAAISFSALCFGAEAEPQFITVTVPGADEVVLNGINNNGQIAGGASFGSVGVGFIRNTDGSFIYLDAAASAIDAQGDVTGQETACHGLGSNTHCFLRASVRKSDGTITHFRIGKGDDGDTLPCCIKSGGWIAGSAISVIAGQDNTYFAFLRNLSGHVTRFSIGGLGTLATGMTAAETIVGYYATNSGLNQGFIKPLKGEAKTFSLDGVGVVPVSINAQETVTGYTYNSASEYHGFIRTSDGKITTFDVSGAGETLPVSINNSGLIAGNYTTGHIAHGFIRSPEGALTTFDAPDATSTFVDGMNEKGVLVGYYLDQSGNKVGFIRTP